MISTLDPQAPVTKKVGALTLYLHGLTETYYVDTVSDADRADWLGMLDVIDELGYDLIEDCEPDYIGGGERFWLEPKEEY